MYDIEAMFHQVVVKEEYRNLLRSFERYCFNKRNTESVDRFVAELKTRARTCNLCDCIRESILRDCIVLGTENEQTTKKLLKERSLTLRKNIFCKFCGYEHTPDKKKCPAWGKICNRCGEKNHLGKKCRQKISSHNWTSPQVASGYSRRASQLSETAVFLYEPV